MRHVVVSILFACVEWVCASALGIPHTVPDSFLFHPRCRFCIHGFPVTIRSWLFTARRSPLTSITTGAERNDGRKLAEQLKEMEEIIKTLGSEQSIEARVSAAKLEATAVAANAARLETAQTNRRMEYCDGMVTDILAAVDG